MSRITVRRRASGQSGNAIRRFVIAARWKRGEHASKHRASPAANARETLRGKTPRNFRIAQTAAYSHHSRMARHCVTAVFREPVALLESRAL